MRDVSLGLADDVRLLTLAKPHLERAQRLLQRIGAERQAIDGKQLQKVAEARALLEAHAPVAIGLSGIEFGVEDKLAIERLVGEPHDDARPFCGSGKDVSTAICIDHLQSPLLNERLHHVRQRKHRGPFRLGVWLGVLPVYQTRPSTANARLSIYFEVFAPAWDNPIVTLPAACQANWPFAAVIGKAICHQCHQCHQCHRRTRPFQTSSCEFDDRVRSA